MYMRNGNLKPIKFNIAYVNVLIEMKCGSLLLVIVIIMKGMFLIKMLLEIFD